MVCENVGHEHAETNGRGQCYYLGEYTPRTGFAFSHTNDLISNLKKSTDRKGTAEWKYKLAAISQFAESLRTAVHPRVLDCFTFVPIPPSKVKEGPDYDDRLVKILEEVRPHRQLDVRELILQRESTRAVHTTSDRITPTALCHLYYVDPSLKNPPPKSIAIFDDLLTTGAHFRAAKFHLRKIYAETRIIGIFLARRALGSVQGIE